jgi:hypothetical protein
LTINHVLGLDGNSAGAAPDAEEPPA